MWLEGHCVLGACWQCCGWRILKRTNEPQISSSLLISNSDRVHSTSFLPLYRFSPPNSCRFRSDYNSFPLSFSLSSIALSLRQREQYHLCFSHSIHLATRAYAPLSLSNNTCSSTVFALFTILDPFSNLYPASRHFRHGRPPPRSSTADPVLLQWEWKDGKKPLHLTCLLFSAVRDRGGRRGGQRPSLFFLRSLNSAPPSPTDRRGEERRGGEGSPKATACAPLSPLPRSRQLG